MSILYDEAQQAIAHEARRIVDARSDKARLLALLETTGDHDRDFWGLAVEQGWSALSIPEAHGGLGLGLVELGLVAQASGSAPIGAPFLAGNHAAAAVLLDSGDAAMRDRWLPRLASGEAHAAIAFAEGGTILPTRPAVRCAADGLQGVKHGVTAGLAADFALVLAERDGQPVLVLAELAGVERRPIDGFDNSRLHADLAFAGTPGEVLLEGEAARAAALDALARIAVVAAHEQLGGAEWLMLAARDYANTRKAFGQPIGAFQSVKHRVAELYALVELARANCIHAAACEGTGEFLRAAAAARLSATEAYDTAARDCVQIHGGIGVTWEHGLHLHMRRARSLAIECGNLLFWEDVLVRELTGVAP